MKSNMIVSVVAQLGLFLVLVKPGAARVIPTRNKVSSGGVRGRYVTRRLQEAQQMEDKPCKAGMMETCAPSSSPSEAPSAAPSTSSMPTTSKSPSASPTVSLVPSSAPTLMPSSVPTETQAPSSDPTSMPSDAPTTAPSLAPSSVPSTSPSSIPSSFPSAGPSNIFSSSPSSVPSGGPSSVPSVAPSSTPSQGPTKSSYPSFAPTGSSNPTGSAPPTLTPSSFPSNSPTASVAPSSSPSAAPSPAPTLSPAPTVDPFGFDTTRVVDPDGNVEVTSTCRNEPPEDTTPVDEQLITYDYILNVESGSDISLILPSITTQVHDELNDDYLDCRYEEGAAPFFVQEQSTLPGDTANSTGCSSGDKEEGTDCYVINTGFTTYIFDYVDSRRKLAETITDKAVLNSYTNSLEEMFQSGAIGGARIVNVQYVGITNSDVPKDEGNNNGGVIAGSVIGGCVLVALIAAAVVLGRKRERQHDQYGEQLAAIEAIDEKTRDDDGSLRNERDPNPFMVVNDDESYGSGFQAVPIPGRNQYEEPTFFVPTDDTAMMSSIQDDLGPKPYESRSGRVYGVEDTVDL